MSGRMNPEKLAKLQEQVRLGGKGTPRRKVKKVSSTKSAEGSTKMQSILKKIGTQPLANIDEVNMFCSDGQVIHFVTPKVQAAVSSNTFMITGSNKLKDLTDLAPGILAQLGPRALANLHAMAQEYQRKAAEAGYSLDDLARMAASGNGLDDENIPDLVKSFESTDIDAN